jgi:hypothetical protein
VAVPDALLAEASPAEPAEASRDEADNTVVIPVSSA